ncbi:MAG: hypothetical protein U1E83_01725 [Methylotetracoccus sp.]
MPEELTRALRHFQDAYHLENPAPDVDKSSLFSGFYRRLALAAGGTDEAASMLGDAVGELSRLIHEWDDRIESSGDPTVLAVRYGAAMRSANAALAPAAQVLFGDPEDFDRCCSRAAARIGSYFASEERAMGAAESTADLHELLRRGNCDFDCYNALLFRVLDERAATSLASFLGHYLVADLIADHIVDLPEDLARSTYNPLVVLHRLLTGEASLPYGVTCSRLNAGDGYQRLLGSPRIRSWFIDCAKRHLVDARTALDSIRPSSLNALLSLCCAGLAEGYTLFESQQGFCWMEPARRLQVLTLLLKPHPWERFHRED